MHLLLRACRFAMPIRYAGSNARNVLCHGMMPAISQVCVEGPEDKLNTTAVSQPAIYVASLAAVEKLRAEKGDEFLSQIDVCCGLSLG